MADDSNNRKAQFYGLEELRAELAGIRANVETIDERWAQWRKSTFSAFSLMAQRDAGDFKERQRRQKALDRALIALGIGLVVVALLLIVLIAVVVGYVVGGTRI